MSIHNMANYDRELRVHRMKKVLAWVGTVLAGSLIVFGAGVSLLHSHIKASDAALCLAIAGLIAWGLWGFVFLKTRH